jgi:hypothetical protein
MPKPDSAAEQPYPTVDPQPRLPDIEDRVLARWHDEHAFEASVEARPAGERVRLLRRSAVRERPSPLRPPPHRVREGHGAPVPDHAGPPRGAPLRLGLPRPPRRGGGRAPARRERPRPSRRLRHRRFNDFCRTSVLRYTSEWERYVTRQARWVDFANDYKTLDLDYMESVMWAFKPCGTRASCTRATASCRTAGAARRRSATPRPAWTTPTGTARTRRSRSCSPSRPASASSPGPPRRGRCRRTSPSPSAPDVDYAVMEEPGGRPLRPRRGTGWPPTRASWTGHAGGHLKGSELVGPPLRAPVPLLRRSGQRVPGARCRLRRPPRTAPAWCTSPPVSVRTTRTSAWPHGIATVVPGGRPGPLHRRGGAVARGEHVFEANPTSSATQGAGKVVRHETYDHNYPHCWRTRTRSSTGGVVWFVQVTAFRDRMVELNQQITWVPEHVKRRLVRQVDRERPGLVHQPQPLLGLADPGVEERRPGATRASTCTARSTSSSVTSACGPRPAPPDGRRARAPQSRRPDRRVDDAARPRGARLLVRVGVHALRPGALPVREQASGSRTTTRATSSSSTSGRRGAGSTRCTSWPPRCSTGRRSAPASATASSWATTARRCRRASATTRPVRDVRHLRRRRHALVPACRRPSCGAPTAW